MPSSSARTSSQRVRGEEYWQLSYSYAGEGHTRYVKPAEVGQLKRELKTYQRFRELTSRWIALEIELAKLQREGSLKKR